MAALSRLGSASPPCCGGWQHLFQRGLGLSRLLGGKAPVSLVGTSGVSPYAFSLTFNLGKGDAAQEVGEVC